MINFFINRNTPSSENEPKSLLYLVKFTFMNLLNLFFIFCQRQESNNAIKMQFFSH